MPVAVDGSHSYGSRGEDNVNTELQVPPGRHGDWFSILFNLKVFDHTTTSSITLAVDSLNPSASVSHDENIEPQKEMPKFLGFFGRVQYV